MIEVPSKNEHVESSHHWVHCRRAPAVTCLSRVVGGHGMVAHWRVAGVHGATVWRPTVMRHWPPVVRLRPPGVHGWGRGSSVRSRGGALALGCRRCSSGGGSSGRLLLHLLPGLHLSVAELLHVEGLTLCEELLTLELQLEDEREQSGRTESGSRRHQEAEQDSAADLHGSEAEGSCHSSSSQ